MKRKILAIWVILLLVAIQVSIAGASQTSTENSETIPVQIASVTPEGTFETETFFMTEGELVELEDTLSVLMEEIQSSKSLNVGDIIDNIIGGNHPVLYSIFKSLFRNRISKSRAFVISQGRGFKFNPFAQNEFKIKKKFTFWHYSSDWLFKGRTIILQPLAFKMRVLTGGQIGFMTGFTGIYLFIERNFPERSHTFFMGIAKNVRGIQLAPN